MMRNKVFLLGLFIALITIMAFCVGTQVHVGEAMPAPQSGGKSLAPIIVRVNATPVSIGVDEIEEYHGGLEGEDAHFCPCFTCMYRVLSAGIREVWSDEIPEQSDTGVKSRLVSNGALHTAWYVIGSG